MNIGTEIEAALLNKNFTQLNHILDSIKHHKIPFIEYQTHCRDLFLTLCQNGQLNALNKLLSCMPTREIADIVAMDAYKPFCDAAANGHLYIMHRLLELAPAEDMIMAANYAPFRLAAIHGQINIVQYLLAKIEKRLRPDMLAAYDYAAFYCAAQNNHLQIVTMLLSVIPHKIDHTYIEFCQEIFNRNQVRVEEILASLTQEEQAEIISIYDNLAIKIAESKEHAAIKEFMLIKHFSLRKSETIKQSQFKFMQLCKEIQPMFTHLEIENLQLQQALITAATTFFKFPITQETYQAFAKDSNKIIGKLHQSARLHHDGLFILLMKWSAAILSLGLILVGSCVKNKIQNNHWNCRFFETKPEIESKFHELYNATKISPNDIK